MVWIFLFTLGAFASDPTPQWPQELEDFQRGLHAKSLGYLDLAQVQSLDADRTADHPTLGRLDGFQEFRRASAAILGPDSSSPVRIGLEGSWEKGGWTPDLYLANPPDPSLSRTSWSFGLCAGWVEPELFAMAGVHHAGAEDWSESSGDARVQEPETDLWTTLRWHRAGFLGAADREGVALSRLSFLPDPSPILPKEPWFLPQLEGFAGWERGDWNRWSGRDAWSGELRAPLLRERAFARIQGSTDGFRLAQVGSDLDPQGLVGLDVSWSRFRDGSVPGVRLRVPVLTFSVNDPDDVQEFATRGTLVWSMRLRMSWEDSQTWYAPGRRPEGRPGGAP